MNRIQAYTLYICHALSTWNARSYEFAAILFIVAAYPEGMRAASLSGISTSLAAICFGSAIGHWIDRGTSRLRTLLTTIIVNRLTIVSACLFWLLIVSDAEQESSSVLHGPTKTLAFSILLGLGVVESLSRKANLISLERSWVPVLCPSCTESYTLTEVNAIMARIDMVCKMVAPISISWFLSAIPSMKLAIGILALLNLLSLGLEWLSAQSLWKMSSGLRAQRQSVQRDEIQTLDKMNSSESPIFGLIRQILSWGPAYIYSLKLYFASEVWAPSLSMCITHTSILSVTGVTVVFLLDSGYSPQLVNIGQTASAFCELSSTFIMPIVVRRWTKSMGNNPHRVRPILQDEPAGGDEFEEVDNPESENTTDDVDAAIARLGVWGIIQMTLILSPTVPILLFLASHLHYPISHNSHSPTMAGHPFLTTLLYTCLSLSRLGRGMFALVVLQLAQSCVPSDQRSSFAGTEQAFVSTSGLGHNLGTAIWSDPSDFGWLALASLIGLTCSCGLYVFWERKGDSWYHKSAGTQNSLECSIQRGRN